VARNRVIEQMRNGMVVVDAETRIMSLNRMAEGLLGIDRAKLIGRKAVQVFAAYPDLLELSSLCLLRRLRSSWTALVAIESTSLHWLIGADSD